MPYPKRSAEFIALIAVSCTLFLFLHTKTLNSKLHEMEIKLQPSELSALGPTGGNAISNEDSKQPNGVHQTYQYLKSTGQKINLASLALNNTKKAEVDLMIFNRVPKVGSQSLMELMKHLGRVNGYKTSRDIPKKREAILLGPMQQIELAAELLAINEPMVYSQHLAFLNFSKMDLPRPIYINLVRDPIERVISWHYYIRNPVYYEKMRMIHGDDSIETPSDTFMNMDFDTCVRTKDKSCIFSQGSSLDEVKDHRRQMLFFCGHSKATCLPFNTQAALERAKRTVEEEYAVVGMWEETNITLTVLEHYVPRFFKHAKLAYYMQKDHLSSINKTTEKGQVSPEVREVLKRNFTREIEFYQFCKQRLYKQYEALRLNGHISDSSDYDSGEL